MVGVEPLASRIRVSRRARSWIAERRTKEHAFGGHLIQVRRQAHGVEAHRADAIAAELIGDDDDDVRLRHAAGLRRGRAEQRSLRHPRAPADFIECHES
jgi:hypothetical protein